MKRLLWADSLKGILVILVVLGHTNQETQRVPFVVQGLMYIMHDESIVITLSFIITLSISWALAQLLSKWGISLRLLLGKI